jgi:NitT/TauT family transport system permease protein
MPAKSNSWLRFWQVALFAALLLAWHVFTSPTLLPPIYFDDANKAAFFFGEPLRVLERVWQWFSSGSIYPHLWVTLVETMLAFVIGTVLGLAIGLWLALSPIASALFDPYIKALNSMPRVHPGPHIRRLVRPRYRVEGGLGRHPGVLHRFFQRLPGG